MQEIIEHPYRVKKLNDGEYGVYHEETGEIWRSFVKESDACRFAYDANGNQGHLSRKKSFWDRVFG